MIALGVLAGCTDDALLPDFDENDRGALLSAQLLESLSETQIEAFGLPITVGSAVTLERITYRTVDAKGNLTQASALLSIPVSRRRALPLASYQHGTIVRRDDVASLKGTDEPETLIGVALATDGYFTVMADYLGLGLSPGLHPYVHAASLATSVIDAMRAARHYAAREGIDLDDRIFLLGYSEGGYATAAAQRMIESLHADEFRLVASAPMAVPWDLSGTMLDLFSSPDPYRAPYYLPYVLLAYNDVYGLEPDLSNVFASPYDETVPPLFDGTRSGGEIDRILPAVPRDMLATGFIEAFTATEPFAWRDRLAENDLVDWSPVTRTRTFHCTSDDLVPVKNAEEAIRTFRQRGVPESVVDLATGDFGTHEECAPVFLLLAKLWIDEIRDGAPAKTRPDVADLRRTTWRPIRP